MDLKPKINLLPQGKKIIPPAVASARRRRLAGVGFFASLLIVAFITTNVVLPGAKISQKLGGGLIKQLVHLTLSSDRELKGEETDRVNILLLGIGGAGHDGPLLTDTIIIASLQPSTGKAALMSLPRDLLIQYPDGQWRKINETYNEGEKKYPGHGGEFTAFVVGSLLNQPITYYGLVDFNGFASTIDQIGGVDVFVDRAFTDSTYPTPDDKTMSVSFQAGWQHFDGEEALIYARSRHGNNGEGSDFARSRRQQKIILATKNKLFSGRVLLNPLTINRLADQLGSHVRTNLQVWEIWRLYSLTRDINPEEVIRLTIDNGPEGILKSSITQIGAFVLIPKTGNFEELKTLAQNVFVTNAVIQEPPRVEIQNGTKVSGLASRAAEVLSKQGYKIVNYSNAEDTSQTTTIVYDFTNGAKPASLAALRLQFNAQTRSVIPAWLIPTAQSLDSNIAASSGPQPKVSTDFLIIIGTDNVSNLTAPPANTPAN
jgi:LCP family protein required for cell wall assembly